MITSSSKSKRVIKRSAMPQNLIIEQYTLPLEQTAKREIVEKKPIFPHYSKDGKKKEADIQEREDEIFRDETEEEQDSRRFREDYLEEEKEEARRILEEASQEAQRILGEAREQARREKEEARTAGYKKGYEDGQREGKMIAEGQVRQEFQQHLDAFQTDVRQTFQAIEMAKEKCIRDYLDQLKDCAIAIGEKVIHISLRSSGEVIKQMIISATEKLKKTAWVKIYIEKCDYDMMMETDTDILDQLSHLSDNIKFIVMDKEERGNCIIEMPEEIIDISVNAQIENIKDILENVRV